MKVFTLLVIAFLGLAREGKAIELPTEALKLTGTAVVGQNYLVGYEWRQDATGTFYGPYAGLDFKQKLYRNFTAELNARMFKGASSDDQAQLGIETAQLSYVGPWFTLAGGRRDVGLFLSPGTFFGSYTTMGERQLDAALLTFPFRLSAEIPDADALVNAPFNALSLLYVPNLFEAGQSVYEGKQGLIDAQLRVKFRIGQASSDVILNYSKGLTNTFEYGTVNNAGSMDISYAFNYAMLGWWVNYAVQSFENAEATSVLAAGAALQAKSWSWGMLHTITFEAQIPLGGNVDNPFTGGDPQDPTKGTLPQWSWFVQVRNKLGAEQSTEPRRLFYGAALTTDPGDYSLARLVEGTISQPVGNGFGVGPRVEGLTLRAASYTDYAGIIYAGYEF